MPGIPASVTTQTSGLKHLQQMYWDKLAVQNFKAYTPFLEACNVRQMPKRSGRAMQLFGYQPYGASSAKAAEGLPGQGLPLNSVVNSVFIDQYVDYLTFSDMLVDTSIDDIVNGGANELSYRGALTVNKVVSGIFDANVTVDSKVVMDLVDNEFTQGSHLRRAEASLDAMDARRRPGGTYMGITHPLVAYDLFSDNTAGSISDTLKRTEAGVAQLQNGVMSSSYQVVKWAGIDLVATSTVPTYTNFPSTGKLGYATYVLGDEAFFATSLDMGRVPKNKNFKVVVKYYDESTQSDPANQIRAAVAFNFSFGVLARPNTNNALPYRRIRGEVAIV